MKQTVLLMVDTQRKDMLSCYDDEAIQTPNIDSLANNGMLFENAYTCQPVCGPARSALFTGLYPHNNGMEANSMPLRQNIKTIGQRLTEEGIECGYIGKWHLDGGDYFGYGRCPDGYNKKYWYDMRNFLDELPNDKSRMLSRKNMSERMDDPKEEDTYAHRCADRAIAFLEEFKEKDFFLTLSFDEPHDPSVCPRSFFHQLKKCKFKLKKSKNVYASLKNKPEHQKIWRKASPKMPYYIFRKTQNAFIACNAFCDYEFGRVLNKIKELKLDPMIIYTSDHGAMLLSHGLVGKGCVMYDEITNIPFIISGGGFKKGTSKTPVSHIDVVPTIMKYYDIRIPQALPGKPLQEIDLTASKRDVFMEFTRYEVDHDGFMGFQPIRSIFDGRYKLVINLMTTDELYDLVSDPFEKNNLIYSKQHEKIRNSLLDKLLDNMNNTRDMYRGYYWYCREWRKGAKPSFKYTGYTRQQIEDDFIQCDYATGLPMKNSVRKK